MLTVRYKCELMDSYAVSESKLRHLIANSKDILSEALVKLASLLKPEEIKAMAGKTITSGAQKSETHQSGTGDSPADTNSLEEQPHNVTSPKRKSSNLSVHFTRKGSDRPNSSAQNTGQSKSDAARRRTNKGPLPPVD
ncbi:unnamed protein product [Heterobilharzia americana]|nr:unnamed protein product [Heterobilharzia americana]